MNGSCGVCERVRAALDRKSPDVVFEFAHSVLMVGDHQFYPGYCVLIAKTHARELYDLPALERDELWQDLMASTRAISEAYQPNKLNHACLGNLDPHVHWHIFPRYGDDPQITLNPWANSNEFKTHLTTDVQREEVRTRLGVWLRSLQT